MTTAEIASPRSATLVEAYLHPSQFIPELRSRKKAAALEEMVQALALTGATRHPEAVLDVVRRREALGSTGLGKGVAIPHARCTLVTERSLLVARSSKGIEYDSPDGAPVQLLFLIVAPPAEKDPVYLRLIADLVRGVRLAKVRQRLLEAQDFSALRNVFRQALDE
jgi:mannitol/fructose-specific phosphotransferase system IIA component (Ntr-type)